MTANHRAVRTVKRRLTIVASVAALVLAAFGTPAGQARLAEGTVAPDEYVPFVTDFPKPAAPAAEAEPSGIDLGDFALAGGIGATLAALAGSAVALTRGGRPSRA